MTYDVDGAITYAREYRSQNQAADALRILADAVLELRAETRVLRGLLNEFRQATEKAT